MELELSDERDGDEEAETIFVWESDGRLRLGVLAPVGRGLRRSAGAFIEGCYVAGSCAAWNRPGISAIWG
jgi:hypothetical protein